jgi:hypothetical protein
MKLSSARIERTMTQFDSQPIPDEHPVMPQLNQMFGDHTFFLGSNGLHVVEPATPSDDGGLTGKIIKLADWKDRSQTSLKACEPEETDIVVLLGRDEEPGRG